MGGLVRDFLEDKLAAERASHDERVATLHRTVADAHQDVIDAAKLAKKSIRRERNTAKVLGSYQARHAIIEKNLERNLTAAQDETEAMRLQSRDLDELTRRQRRMINDQQGLIGSHVLSEWPSGLKFPPVHARSKHEPGLSLRARF